MTEENTKEQENNINNKNDLKQSKIETIIEGNFSNLTPKHVRGIIKDIDAIEKLSHLPINKHYSQALKRLNIKGPNCRYITIKNLKQDILYTIRDTYKEKNRQHFLGTITYTQQHLRDYLKK